MLQLALGIFPIELDLIPLKGELKSTDIPHVFFSFPLKYLRFSNFPPVLVENVIFPPKFMSTGEVLSAQWICSCSRILGHNYTLYIDICR